jgi:hypothetical protein
VRHLLGHAKTEIVAVRISHRKLTQSPRLVNRRGVNWRLRTLGCIQTPSSESLVALINVVYKHTVYRTEDAVSGMTRELQFGPVPNQVYDSVGHLAVFVSGSLALEVENFGVEV